jgi:hypothetical protein
MLLAITKPISGTLAPKMPKTKDRISWLFAKGPSNKAEVAELDVHIELEAKKINSNWTDEEREKRASRAGSPVRQSFSVPEAILPRECSPLAQVEE